MGNIWDSVGHSHKQKHRKRGAPQGCPCAVYVSITSDKTIFPSRQESAEKLLHVCLGSVSVFKLTWSRATEIKLATLQLRKPEVARHMKSACFSFGSTVWFTATQARIKNYGKAPAVRVKHLISCSYKDLAFLAKTLRVLEESQPTLIFLNWPRNWECWRLLRDVHMSMGTRKVSLWGGHHQWFWWSRPHGLRWRIFFFSQWSVFILWPRHRHGCPNSHWCTQPASCSLTPFWHELETEACLCSSSKEDATGGGKKDIQKSKKRKGQGFGDGPLLLDESWDNWDGLGTWTQDSNTGYGDSSSSTAWVWRPKNRWVYTSSKRRR